MGGGGVSPTPRPPLPRERPGSHCTGGWVGPRAAVHGRKISSQLGFDPGPSSPWSVAIPTELPAHWRTVYTRHYTFHISLKWKTVRPSLFSGDDNAAYRRTCCPKSNKPIFSYRIPYDRPLAKSSGFPNRRYFVVSLRESAGCFPS